ncbi:MAG: hypothetical protein U5K74_15915 [Gemmatimonadaceae bacterium]|nr:hypothetical protein [Gemmatimonadaceae bacterium]
MFALTTVALVAILAWVVDRWLRRHAAAIAVDAERQVQTVGVAGLPTATGAGALNPLASAFADAGARAALAAAERENAELLAQLGSDAASAAERAMERLRDALSGVTIPDAARVALHTIDETSRALREVTTAVPEPAAPIDLVAELREVVAVLESEGAGPSISTIIETDRGMVLVDRARVSDHLRVVLQLARRASPPDSVVSVNVSRIFRSNLEETPVRRTGDSRLTIVPRPPGDALRAWVQRAQPGAEVLSIVISDAGPPPNDDEMVRGLDAFAVPRPADPLGVTLATVRRTVLAAKGTMWVDGSREGGTAVHLLFPLTSG